MISFVGIYKSINRFFKEIILIDNSMLYNVLLVIFRFKLRVVVRWVVDFFCDKREIV